MSSATLQLLYADAQRMARRVESARLPRVDLNDPNPDDLFAFGKAVADRAGFTEDHYREALRFARAHDEGGS